MANHNHHANDIIHFFKEIASLAKGAYGLLFVSDDEDFDNENNFIVWRIRKGHVDKLKDSYLSPINPCIEES